MGDADDFRDTPIRLRRYVWLLMSCWTVAMAITLTWELLDERNKAIERAQRMPSDSSVWSLERSEMVHRLVGYGTMWAIGMLGILAVSRQLRRQVDARCLAEEALQETNLMLEDRVEERTRDLATANLRLRTEMAERRQAEQWLLESEERFRGCFEQGIFGMAILSAEKQLVEVNDWLCKMLGYSAAELADASWEELIHPDDRAAEDAHFNRMLAGVVKGYSLETRLLHKDGESQTVSLSVRVQRKDNGEVDCVIAFVQDSFARPSAKGTLLFTPQRAV